MTIEKRIEALEKRAKSGPLVTCYLFDQSTWEMLPQDEQARVLAEAEAEAGEYGTVLAVKVEEDWKGNEHKT